MMFFFYFFLENKLIKMNELDIDILLDDVRMGTCQSTVYIKSDLVEVLREHPKTAKYICDDNVLSSCPDCYGIPTVILEEVLNGVEWFYYCE